MRIAGRDKTSSTQYFSLLPEIEETLKAAMIGFDAFDPEFVAGAIDEANEIIDNYLGSKAKYHPRYAWFDHLDEQYQEYIEGIAHLLPLPRHREIISVDARDKGQGMFHTGYSYQLLEEEVLIMLTIHDHDGDEVVTELHKTNEIDVPSLLKSQQIIGTENIDTAVIFNPYEYSANISPLPFLFPADNLN